MDDVMLMCSNEEAPECVSVGVDAAAAEQQNEGQECTRGECQAAESAIWPAMIVFTPHPNLTHRRCDNE
jgi:hypothetical protein